MKHLSTAGLVAAVTSFGLACSVALRPPQMQGQMPGAAPSIQAGLASLPDAPIMQAAQGTSAAQSEPSPNPLQASPSPVPTQTSASSQGTANPSDVKQQQKNQAARDVKAEEKQRLLGIMPQFQLVQGGQAPPLTPGQKFDLALHSAIDPFYIGWAFVVGGGWGEVVDSNKGYGWGDRGYFRRVGANYADNVDGAIIGNALLPIVLHQDPRYFRVGTGSFGHRFVSAALSTVVCRGDNGKRQPNVSNVAGNFIAGGISNLYYPKDERGAKLTVENGISVTLFGALGGQFLEFGPDINRMVHRRKNDVPSSVAAAPQSITAQ